MIHLIHTGNFNKKFLFAEGEINVFFKILRTSPYQQTDMNDYPVSVTCDEHVGSPRNFLVYKPEFLTYCIKLQNSTVFI